VVSKSETDFFFSCFFLGTVSTQSGGDGGSGGGWGGGGGSGVVVVEYLVGGEVEEARKVEGKARSLCVDVMLLESKSMSW